MYGTLKINDDGSASITGMDMGGRVKFLERSGNKVLIQVSGYTGWCGRGETKYYFPSFVLLYLNGDRVEHYTDFSYTRALRKQALEMVKKVLHSKKDHAGDASAWRKWEKIYEMNMEK